MVEILPDEVALRRIAPGAVEELTRRGTDSTYRSGELSGDDRAFIDRVIRISAESVATAAANPRQRLAAAFEGEVLAGFVIATIHDEHSRELDWLFVDPGLHGSGLGDALIRSGMDWLGTDKPMWLNVVRSNERAIRFYERHGFKIDPAAECAHRMPHWIMRRPADRRES